MRWLDIVQWIWRSVTSGKQRSSLTITGIAIGIMAVAMLTSVGEGLRHYLLESFSQFGTRIIAVTPGKSSTLGASGVVNSVRPLSLDDAKSLRELPFVETVVPVISGTARVEAGRYTRNTNVFGVGPQAAEAWLIGVSKGSFLPDDKLESARSLAVLGAGLKKELFGLQNPLGQLVRVGHSRFRVVGVMESKGQLLGFDLDDAIYIPISRAQQLFNRDGLMEVDVVFSEQGNSRRISALVKERLIARHGAEDFTLFTQEDMLGSLDKILNIMTLIVAALGGISLLVGGVGVLTIMTTALQERTREIGLLCALGANSKQIVLLFLGEAIVLAASGGVIGLFLVVVLVLGVNVFAPDIPLALNGFYLFLALGLSMLVGLLAGIGPALRAAHLNPIAALHTE
ncbi:ABC transporter permease [Spongiibacter sp. KMU-158]|uniref:ABC transporter permease n=1 Tax=Spongiibacter pelagi TaxID=2760804 RepID=A0A927C355_9GAMM|nr:ABC transporter permease [Spongiibacter pelagi]MBD2859929.1 ABC transporter permease [Spongiibacter pelagi]